MYDLITHQTAVVLNFFLNIHYIYDDKMSVQLVPISATVSQIKENNSFSQMILFILLCFSDKASFFFFF